MLQPSEISKGQRLTVEFMNVYGNGEEPTLYDWIAEEKPVDHGDEVDGIVIPLTYIEPDEQQTSVRLRYTHDDGRYRIERQADDGTWFRWNKEAQCDVRKADLSETGMAADD